MAVLTKPAAAVPAAAPVSTPSGVVPAVQETSAQAPALVQRGAVISGAMPENQNPVDAAKRTKQHQACMKLAANNPSITCQ